MRHRILAIVLLLAALPVACAAPASPTALPPTATAAPQPTPTLYGGTSVTLDDDGKTIDLAVGQRFLLNLGEFYEWQVTPEDPSIVSRVPNILTIRGSQGIYEAHRAGRTVLNATGDPQCRKVVPPCGAASRFFHITVIVR